MRKGKITLKIKDLALLKSNPTEYYRKTHDGTSMGNIGPVLDNWAVGEGNSGSYCLFDEEGRRVRQTFRPGAYSSEGYIWDKYKEIPEAKNLHYITQPYYSGGTYKEDENDVGFNATPARDFEKLITEKNENGDYMLRSLNSVKPNGIIQQLIRNDKYSETDDENFRKAVQHYDDVEGDFRRLWNKTEQESRGEGVDSVKEATKKIGTFQQYLKDQGVLDDFEKANCKMRFRKNTYKQKVNRRFDDWEPGTYPELNAVEESEKPDWAKGI